MADTCFAALFTSLRCPPAPPAPTLPAGVLILLLGAPRRCSMRMLSPPRSERQECSGELAPRPQLLVSPWMVAVPSAVTLWLVRKLGGNWGVGHHGVCSTGARRVPPQQRAGMGSAQGCAQLGVHPIQLGVHPREPGVHVWVCTAGCARLGVHGWVHTMTMTGCELQHPLAVSWDWRTGSYGGTASPPCACGATSTGSSLSNGSINYLQHSPAYWF